MKKKVLELKSEFNNIKKYMQTHQNKFILNTTSDKLQKYIYIYINIYRYTHI